MQAAGQREKDDTERSDSADGIIVLTRFRGFCGEASPNRVTPSTIADTGERPVSASHEILFELGIRGEGAGASLTLHDTGC